MRKLTLAEASNLYDLHHTTLRRWVKSGRLSRQEIPGKHGSRLVVDEDELLKLLGISAISPSNGNGAESEHTQNGKHADALHILEDVERTHAYAEPTQADPTQAQVLTLSELERANAMAEYNTKLVAPWVAQVTELHTAVIAQAEEIGKLKARLEAANERIAQLEEPATPDEKSPAPAPHRTWWKVWQRNQSPA